MSRWVQWEAGSMFHWEDDFAPPFWTLPRPGIFYLICRHAIAALCAAEPKRPVLWLPTFFCPEVARFCQDVATVREYRDDCRWPEPDWKSLQPGPHDLVLAVNYFGVRSSEPWYHWRKGCACVLVEDHTQDPFSTWALQSVADYAVCSLRKTLPVPDGAILWSPTDRVLPVAPRSAEWTGSVLKLGAMLYKREYLRGGIPAECKLRYRELQLEGEQKLNEARISSISPISEAILARGIPASWRERRIRNARTLLRLIRDWTVATPVFTDWPDGAAPFDIPLVFKDRASRDMCQRRLRQENVFCPVEWVCVTEDRQATELSSRILSIPIDHRYEEDDIQRIAKAISCVEMQVAFSSKLGDGYAD